MSSKYILIADDEPNMRRVLEIMLRKMGHTVFAAADGQEAFELARGNAIDLVITDLRMPRMDGITLLSTLREAGIDAPVIVITAHGTVESAVDAMKRGASDYLLRPFDLDALELAIERVLGGVEVARQNSFLREELDRGWQGFIGTSAAMQAVYEQIRQVAPSRATVMITGETGSGKEVAARAIHAASPRKDKLFVPINCAAIPAEMLESELFGHEKGAFTGAVRERVGKFELADGGTLFLDEITEMPLALQAKLLRVLQEGSIERLGSNRTLQLDLRLIAATNRDPRTSIAEGHLREDLFYRLNVFALELPALRQRKEDIAALVRHFADKHRHAGLTGQGFETGLFEHLEAYDWPGNVRELENTVERALVLAGGAKLGKRHFPLAATAPAEISPIDAETLPEGPLSEVVEALEQRLIERALLRSEGNKTRAAALLGISERTLWYKLKKLRGDQA
ncbi:sigma-54-dependent transcriptional regulator [Cognatazoarcus halotolerans]|uniref:sigma-54-dependent transcriptional regulator n=1 Tax=Cognatazoarcus halotolerans TaxID=2686016 RepID=UPI0013597E0D|nr:sigma-54 dependent transcriptional regulator [Cognatazoarcus halotolerans]MCB1900940.1 sigma-54-dependent Fis family transcriptional regulator [Rhodocyclaceae bacterium]MCP5310168.1 sigma-54-dependent Fis family transcriptional regulator [Zoogloeaceae bacterium]